MIPWAWAGKQPHFLRMDHTGCGPPCTNQWVFIAQNTTGVPSFIKILLGGENQVRRESNLTILFVTKTPYL